MVALLGDVAEVLSLPAYTSVPLSKPWLLGDCQCSGTVTTDYQFVPDSQLFF
ncbi:MAG: hypothetical protein U1E98_01380 [Moraxella osloensis]